MSDGRIITAADIRLAVTTTLKLWLPTMLEEVYRQSFIDSASVAKPKSYSPLETPDQIPDARLPAIIINVESATWEQRATWYDAAFACNIQAVVAAKTRVDTVDLADRYAAAITASIGQHGALGGLAQATRITTTDYSTLQSETSRTVVGVTVTFTVHVENVMSRYTSIKTPPLEGVPPPALQTVHEVRIDAIPEEGA